VTICAAGVEGETAPECRTLTLFRRKWNRMPAPPWNTTMMLWRLDVWDATLFSEYPGRSSALERLSTHSERNGLCFMRRELYGLASAKALDTDSVSLRVTDGESP
jgi:hypothetical protein